MSHKMTGCQPKFFVGRGDRLISRLRLILETRRFADQVNGQVFIMWPNVHQRYGEEREDYQPWAIFDLPKFYAEGGGERLIFVEGPIVQPPGTTNLLDDRFKPYWRDGFEKSFFEDSDQSYFINGILDANFVDESIDREDRETRARQYFDELPINPHLISRRNDLTERFGLSPKDFGALHVRRGDCYSMLQGSLEKGLHAGVPLASLHRHVEHFVRRTAPLEFYEPEVEEMLARTDRVVFTSDSPETITMFEARFGAGKFVNLGKLHKGMKPIQKAFLDFLVIKDAQQVVGTWSNFSYLAALLGDVRYINVAATGPVERMRQSLAEDIIEDRDVDPQTLQACHDHIDAFYPKFAAGRKSYNEKERQYWVQRLAAA